MKARSIILLMGLSLTALVFWHRYEMPATTAVVGTNGTTHLARVEPMIAVAAPAQKEKEEEPESTGTNEFSYSRPKMFHSAGKILTVQEAEKLGVNADEFEKFMSELRHDLIKQLLPYVRVVENGPFKVRLAIEAPPAVFQRAEREATGKIAAQLGLREFDNLVEIHPHVARVIERSMLYFGAFNPVLTYEVEREAAHFEEGVFPVIRRTETFAQTATSGYTNENKGRYVGDLSLVERDFELAMLALEYLKPNYPKATPGTAIPYVPKG